MLAEILPKQDADYYPLTPVEVGYLAGIIDGEGALVLTKRQGSPTQHQPQVVISSTTKPMLDWMCIRFDGRVTRIDSIHNHCWRWVCPAIQLGRLLYLAMPYLVVKKRQALLLLYWLRYCQLQHRWARTPAIEEKLVRVYRLLSLCHMKGPRKFRRARRAAC